MVLRLDFKSTYLSITHFPTVYLPDFTLITGLNGSGKSHLLQALKNGNIEAECTPNQSTYTQNDIRLFDWSTMVPQDTGTFSSENIRNERQGLYQQINNIKNHPHFVEPIRSTARNLGLNHEYTADISRLVSIDVNTLKSKFPENGQAERIVSELRSAIFASENMILNQYDDSTRRFIQNIISTTGKSIFAICDKDLFSSPIWGQTNIFQQSFAKLFVAYRDMFLENELAKIQKQNGEAVDFLTDTAFQDRYGPAPWDFVNTSLASAGLGFEINRPHMYSFSPYDPRISNKRTGTQILFQNLSSGEKILMSFAFCIYYAQDRRQLSSYPKLLLLDEVDAPLHPSMSRGMIETIQNTLVKEFSIKIIATTHSPSTVAMAEDESIYVMHSNGSGLARTPKAAALNILTDGVPTLSLNYSGRKQIFVESAADAQTYSDLYRVMKSRMNSECSLEFIATGIRTRTGEEENTGCSVVKKLVGGLAASGNSTVFGLIDWDKKNIPTKRVLVLAHETRDGLENVLLDPLLLCGLIIRDLKQYKSIIGISEDTSYLDFVTMPIPQLQSIVNSLCVHMLGGKPFHISKSSYLGGFSLDIDERCFRMDDHMYEQKIYDSFPGMLAIAKQKKPGLLMQRIINTIILDKRDFAPIEIYNIFSELLNKPNHLEEDKALAPA